MSEKNGKIMNVNIINIWITKIIAQLLSLYFFSRKFGSVKKIFCKIYIYFDDKVLSWYLNIGRIHLQRSIWMIYEKISKGLSMVKKINLLEQARPNLKSRQEWYDLWFGSLLFTKAGLLTDLRFLSCKMNI